MRSISSVVTVIVDANPTLQFGLYHGLLNLTQVARFIRPQVEARLGKPVKVPAILMGLSRLQKELQQSVEPAASGFEIERMSVQSGLCAITLPKSLETHAALDRLFARTQTMRGYITVTEGTGEITAIMDQELLEDAGSILRSAPKRVVRDLAGLGIQISERFTGRPGFLYTILQQVALQGISVVEVTSTTSEFNVYLAQDDVRLAFDSIYNRFRRR